MKLVVNLKQIIIIGFICLLPFYAFAKEPIQHIGNLSNGAQDHVLSFEQIIKSGYNKVNGKESVIFIEKSSSFLKRKYTINSLKYDVKRTDSLISPVIAVATFNLAIENSQRYQTKEEADSAQDGENKVIFNFSLILNYAFQSGSWVMKDGESKLTILSEKMHPISVTIKPEKLLPDDQFIDWAIYRFLP